MDFPNNQFVFQNDNDNDDDLEAALQNRQSVIKFSGVEDEDEERDEVCNIHVVFLTCMLALAQKIFF